MKICIEHNILPFLNSGLRVVGCHTQALLSSSSALIDRTVPALFEACTTVPFGIAHVPADPNRLLNSIVDPDIGLDLACSALGIKTVRRCFRTQNDHNKAIGELIRLLDDGPVVLGPLNMGLLPYLRNRQQFIGLDHYIVAVCYEPVLDEVTILDPERVGLVHTELQNLIPAWGAEDLLEGRGPYTMRQVKDVPPVLDWQTGSKTVVHNVQRNLNRLRIETLPVLQIFCNTTLDKRKNRSLWSGLTFCLETRIRRIICCCSLIKEILGCRSDGSRQSFQWAEQAILSCRKLIYRLSTENELIPSEIIDVVNAELELGNFLNWIT